MSRDTSNQLREHRSERKPMIYFAPRYDGVDIKIGYASNIRNRFKELAAHGYTFHAAICGGKGEEAQFHDYFSEYHISNEYFRLEGELQKYVEWLGRQPFSACDIDEAWLAYPFPGRFPWEKPDLVEGGQLSLGLMEEIVPGLKRPLPLSSRQKIGMSTGQDEWYTEEIYLDAAREVLGTIELDPATSARANLRVQAQSVFTEHQDGLRFQWVAKTVWLNPPFSDSEPFVHKLVHHYKAGEVAEAIICVNNHATDSEWFQILWEFPVCFAHHRPNFDAGFRNPDEPKKSSASKGAVFVYLGSGIDRFAECFCKFGPIVRTYMPAATTRQELRQLRKQRAS